MNATDPSFNQVYRIVQHFFVVWFPSEISTLFVPSIVLTLLFNLAVLPGRNHPSEKWRHWGNFALHLIFIYCVISHA